MDYSTWRLARIHDKFELELKYAYPLSNQSKVKYRFATYIFIPDALSINENTYSKARFYQSIKEYFRLKTPVVELKDFRSNQSKNSLNDIKQLTKSKDIDVDQYSQTSRLLSRTLRSSLRDYSYLIRDHIKANDMDQVEKDIAIFAKEAGLIANDWRSTRPNDDQKEILIWFGRADEIISLFIEDYSMQIIRSAEKHKISVPSLADLRNCAFAEVDYRKKMGYKTILREDSDNEEFTTRAWQLKKYSSSILYLDTNLHTEGKKMEQFYFALAAGIAMVFATLIAFYYGQQYGQFTLPFFIALVVAYMLKDRIKDLGKLLFTMQMGRRLFDRRTYLTTTDHKLKIGYVRDKFRFVLWKNLPNSVVEQRKKSDMTTYSSELPERIIRYAKEFVFNHIDLQSGFEGPEPMGVVNILRFDVSPYLKKMTDPMQSRWHLNEQGHPESVNAHRVYPVNLIITMQNDNDPTEQICQHLTLVLDREGICRIENIFGPKNELVGKFKN